MSRSRVILYIDTITDPTPHDTHIPLECERYTLIDGYLYRQAQDTSTCGQVNPSL